MEGLDPYFSRYLPQVVVTCCVPVALVGWLFMVNPPAAAILAVAVARVLVIRYLRGNSRLQAGGIGPLRSRTGAAG
ncbi:hypothetical protein [Nonomuraea sp. NPDC049504]|uniref:hypothetical protein n=1 Tax=Nonomuraea sp. NPDC049504 TaxID=3154729 RepID=UPI00343D541F